MTQNLGLARRFQERVHSYINMGLLNESAQLKKDWRTFSYILSTVPIADLYHITSSQNVQSIFEHGGLISRKTQDSTGFLASYRAQQRPDTAIKYDHCVHLSFCRDISILKELEKQNEHAVLLTIDPIAALLKGTIFLHCDTSGDDPSTQLSEYESTESLLKINFDAELNSLSVPLEILGLQETPDQNAKILVPNKVPSFLIKNIKFISSGIVNKWADVESQPCP